MSVSSCSLLTVCSRQTTSDGQIHNARPSQHHSSLSAHWHFISGIIIIIIIIIIVIIMTALDEDLGLNISVTLVTKSV